MNLEEKQKYQRTNLEILVKNIEEFGERCTRAQLFQAISDYDDFFRDGVEHVSAAIKYYVTDVLIKQVETTQDSTEEIEPTQEPTDQTTKEELQDNTA